MGSSNNSAQKAAERREREREAQILANTGQVNAIYDSPERAQQIEEFTAAVRQQYMGELQRQQGINSRQLDFSLARAGQTGGSLDRDQNKELGESFQRGVLRSEQGAQNSAAQLRADDEASRNQMLALVQSGGDVQSALANAAASQRNNLLSAKSTVDVRSIGDAYSGLSDIFSRSKQQSEYRRGLQDYNNMYGSAFSFGGNGGP